MKVWIRADGNEQIGTGHVMRCLAMCGGIGGNRGTGCFVMADDAAELVKSRGKRQGSPHTQYDHGRRNCLY